MFKKMLRPLAMLVVLSMVFASLAACTTTPTAAPTTAPASSAAAATEAATQAATAAPTPTPTVKAPDPVTLEFIAPSPVTTVNDFDAVLAKFEEETAATINAKIHYTFTGFDNIGDKISLKLSAGEPVDCCFTAQWTSPSVMEMISKGELVNLDNYFTDATNYPGLNKAFTQDYLRNNSFADTTGAYHVYAIPFGLSFAQGYCIYYRKDLATKYGIGDIKTYDDLVKFCEAIKTNEPGMVPFSQAGSGNTSGLLQTLTDPAPSVVKHNIASIGSVNIVIKDDGSLYAAKTYYPEVDPAYQALEDASLSTLDPLRGFKMAREWYTKGYLEKDVLNQKDPEGQFMAGKAASYYRGIDVFSAVNTRLQASVPGAELGYMMVDQGVRFNLPKYDTTDFKVWNFASVPVTSKNADRVMQVFNWIFSSQDNHDLFELGLPGTDWVAVGDSNYKIPDGKDPATVYNFPGFILTNNPTMHRYDSATPTDVVSIMKELGDTNFFSKSPTAGFSFVTDPVKTQMTKLNEVGSQWTPLMNGVIADVPGEYARIQKLYDQAGFQDVRTEALKQFGEYLKTNPYEGQ